MKEKIIMDWALTPYKFNIGDNVSRYIDIYDKSKGLKVGKIIRRYSEPQRQYSYFTLGPYPELYEVKWNNGETEKGFLPHGLTAIHKKESDNGTLQHT